MAIRASTIVASLFIVSAAALPAGAAHGAELGEARVASHLGQPLAASLELTALEDAASSVGVRLAHPDVYKGANIGMPPVLSSLNLHVARRDGRQFLYLSTAKPVESRHLHVYLELTDAGQRSVRLVTLWLTPNPDPAPVPVPVPVPQAAAIPVAVAAVPAPPVRATPPTPVATTRPAAALQDNEQYLEPRKAPVRRVAKAAPEKKAAAASVPLAVFAPPAPPPACAPQPAAGQLDACAALGEKNAALRQELGQIEAKVKLLQGGRADAAAPAVAPAADTVATPMAAKPAPKGAPRIQTKPKKPAPPEVQTPWGLIGAAVAAVLALAGGAVWLLRRRKRSSFGKIPKEHKPARVATAGQGSEPAPDGAPPKPSIMASVKARLMPGPRKAPAPQAVEPAPENVET